jgi:hypothetical protein
LDIGIVGGLDVKELAVPVVADVDDQGIGSQPTQLADFGPGSQFLEFGFDVGGVHVQEDTSGGEVVR